VDLPLHAEPGDWRASAPATTGSSGNRQLGLPS